MSQRPDIFSPDPGASEATARLWALLQRPDELTRVSEAILAGADVASSNKYGCSPLNLAINAPGDQAFACIDALLAAGAPLFEKPGVSSAIQAASRFLDRGEMRDFLLSRAGRERAAQERADLSQALPGAEAGAARKPRV